MASILKTAVTTAVVVIPATVTFLDVIGYVAKVEGASMQPCLNPSLNQADYVVLSKWKARNWEFERGEVVSLVSPTNPEQRIIKRIVGLEGDIIKTLNYRKRYVRIPEGHCWVEGDHKGQSMDSNLFGPVSLGVIQAKATRIVWPPNRWQKLATSPALGRIKANGSVKGDSAELRIEREEVENELLMRECDQLMEDLGAERINLVIE